MADAALRERADARALPRAAPATGWFNRFLVLEQPDHYVHNDGNPLSPGEHDDINVFPSKDAAETFAIETMKRQDADVRAAVMWLGAFPEEDRREPPLSNVSMTEPSDA